MTYLTNVEHEIRKLRATATNDALIRYVKAQLLQSYKNGMKAGATAPVSVWRRLARFLKRPHA